MLANGAVDVHWIWESTLGLELDAPFARATTVASSRTVEDRRCLMGSGGCGAFSPISRGLDERLTRTEVPPVELRAVCFVRAIIVRVKIRWAYYTAR